MIWQLQVLMGSFDKNALPVYNKFAWKRWPAPRQGSMVDVILYVQSRVDPCTCWDGARLLGWKYAV